MRVGIVGSMQHIETMIALKDQLIRLGHDAYVTNLADGFIDKSDDEKEKLKLSQKTYEDPIMEFWNLMQEGDAILVANYDKNVVANYIGGNTLMEIGFAHVLKQKIFLLNPIPEIPYYKSEIEAVKPKIINRNLALIL